jgi:hypothetical protein
MHPISVLSVVRQGNTTKSWTHPAQKNESREKEY